MLFPTKSHRCQNPPGQVTTRHLEGNIVETVYSGHCSPELVQSVLDITPEVLERVKGAAWLLDMSAATGVDSGARVPGLEILKRFRGLGGSEFAVVIKYPPLRMLFTAVAFAAMLPVKFFDDPAEALRHLRAVAPAPPPESGPSARRSIPDSDHAAPAARDARRR